MSFKKKIPPSLSDVDKLCRQEQRVFTVYADAQLYKDLWANFLAWCKNYQHIPGFYGFHVNMPITPHAVQQGIAKGGNSLGLEDAGDRVLGGMSPPFAIARPAMSPYLDMVRCK